MRILYRLIVLLVSTQILFSDCSQSCKKSCSYSQNSFLPHAFSSSSLKDLQQEKYLWNKVPEYNYQNFQTSVAVEYQQNFSGNCHNCKNLGSLPFWSGTNRMTFGINDGKADIDAYQLGLGNLPVNEDGISGYIELNPKFRQVGADLLLYYVKEKEEPGVYFKIHAPLSAVSITQKFKETNLVSMAVSDSFEQTTQRSNPDNPETSSLITYYDIKYPIAQTDNLVSNYLTGATLACDKLNGDIFRPLRLDKGRIATKTQTEIRLADLSFSLGYNFLMRENGFLGAAFKVTCPTGNVAKADFMLEPIVGRGGYWGVGAEVTAMYRLWENVLDTDSINFWFQGEVIHLMPGRKPNMRSFDLKQNGKGSKYLLVQHYDLEYIRNETNDLTFNVGQQAQGLYPAIDITTLPIISKIPVEGSCAVLFDYIHKSWNIALGIEAWGRATECLSIDTASAAQRRHPNLNEFAVIGRQHSSYLIDDQAPANNPLATYYCQPLATINSSQEAVILVGALPNVTAPENIPDGIADARLSENRIPAKLEEALDIQNARIQSTITGKLFGQVGYTYKKCKFTPYVAAHGFVELTGKTNHALNMWGAGIQAGLNF